MIVVFYICEFKSEVTLHAYTQRHTERHRHQRHKNKNKKNKKNLKIKKKIKWNVHFKGFSRKLCILEGTYSLIENSNGGTNEIESMDCEIMYNPIIAQIKGGKSYIGFKTLVTMDGKVSTYLNNPQTNQMIDGWYDLIVAKHGQFIVKGLFVSRCVVFDTTDSNSW